MQARLLAIAALASAAAVPAFAHHSGAMFDSAKSVTFQGVIKEVQFTNPHSWIQIVVTDAAGKPTEWSFEAQAPTVLVRQGFTKTSFKPGDKVTVKGHPLKDGRPGAELQEITTASGQVLPKRDNPGAGAEG